MKFKNCKIDISNGTCCIYSTEPTNNYGGYPYGYPSQIMQNMNMAAQQPTYQQQIYPVNQNQFIQQQPLQNVNPYQPQQFNPYNTPIQQLVQESYYDPETMQTISNDMPLKSAFNSPLEKFKSTYTPGAVTGYVELEKSDGTKDKAFVQGGTIKVKGGYNPVTGITTEPRTIYPAQQMNNPMTSMYSPFIQVPNMNNGYYNNRYMMPNYGAYGYVMGYPLTEFDTYIQEAIYEENPSVLDGIELLEAVVLSDEDREKINHNREYGNNLITRDYYGRPIYNTYAVNRMTQDQTEQLRNHQINHFMRLSKIVHTYTGEPMDEERVKKVFDPMSHMTPAVQQGIYKKPFNFYGATEEERNDYINQQRIEQCKVLDNVFDLRQQMMMNLNMQKALAYKRIKDSHDALIGVAPGEHYSLSTYLTNGYRIGVNAEMYKLKKLRRNGKLKYNSKAYRNQIVQRGVERGIIKDDTNMIASSKDDEYLTIESVIKQAYECNKANIPLPEPKGPQSIMIDFGGNKPKISPVEDVENNPDLIRDKFFRATYELAEEKNRLNELRRAAMS